MSGKTICIAGVTMSKWDCCLKGLSTIIAKIALNGKGEKCLLLAYWKVVDLAVYDPILDYMIATTMRTFYFFNRNTFEL